MIIKLVTVKGSSNLTVFNLTDSTGAPIDLDAAGATLVRVRVCDTACIDSASGDVAYSGDVVSVRFGALNLDETVFPGVSYKPRLEYITASDPNPYILAGEGMATEIQLRVVC